MFKKRTNKHQRIVNLSESVENDKLQNQSIDLKQEEILEKKLPSKKVKQDIISSSTTENKTIKEFQLHQNFKSLNYSASQQSILYKTDQSASKDQLLLEQELAKQKYLENVNITKQIKDGKLDTKIYRGINNYANYALTQDQIVNAQQKFRKRQGPSRVNSTIRNTCRFDYNFGLCKDWHDSGYCPFGDSCIYLHDRSNYKTGWEQEKDFERAEKQRWKRISNPELAAKQDLEESLKVIQKYKVNQTCQKCKNEYKSPVEVECGHIFCSSCSLAMNKCKICNKKLSGIMNNAEKKMQKNKQNYQQLKAKILKQHEQNQMRRKRYEKIDSQNVFAD